MRPLSIAAVAVAWSMLAAVTLARAQNQRTAPAPVPSVVPNGKAQPTLPTVKLSAGLHVITAEVADAPQARQLGLMFRTSLAPNHGMVFVFDYASTQCMWMRNTLIPLSVAFIDDGGRIVNIETMKPHDETTRHCSAKPVRYALEMTEGWFAQRGLAAGSTVAGLPR